MVTRHELARGRKKPSLHLRISRDAVRLDNVGMGFPGQGLAIETKSSRQHEIPLDLGRDRVDNRGKEDMTMWTIAGGVILGVAGIAVIFFVGRFILDLIFEFSDSDGIKTFFIRVAMTAFFLFVIYHTLWG
jgi:hypothetical protein